MSQQAMAMDQIQTAVCFCMGHKSGFYRGTPVISMIIGNANFDLTIKSNLSPTKGRIPFSLGDLP